MNARPTYLCGGLYTFLGAVAAIGTVERFAKHPAGGSLLFVGGSWVLLFAGILIIRETGIQRALQGRPIEPLLQGNQLGADDLALSKTNARAQCGSTSSRSPILGGANGSLTSRWEPCRTEYIHTGSHDQASRAARRSAYGVPEVAAVRS